MKQIRGMSALLMLMVVSAGAALAQQKSRLGDNAALRYWSAFAQMQDVALTDAQVDELNLILGGTAPYQDLKYRELVEKNRPALETMARGTEIPDCDWGIDYALGPDAPVEYARKALTLGRLNVLYSLHLLQNRKTDDVVRALVAGVRFSRDVANGGTLFATLVAKNLLAAHLRTIDFAVHIEQLSEPQREQLQKALASVGPAGLDWQSALKREFSIKHDLDAPSSAALGKISAMYVAALNNPSELPQLKQMIASAPQSVQQILPNPERVIKEKEDLAGALAKARAGLR